MVSRCTTTAPGRSSGCRGPPSHHAAVAAGRTTAAAPPSTAPNSVAGRADDAAPELSWPMEARHRRRRYATEVTGSDGMEPAPLAPHGTSNLYVPEDCEAAVAAEMSATEPAQNPIRRARGFV